MQAEIKVFDGHGDTILREYDPATADMQEVNEYIKTMEQQFHGRAFDTGTGEQIDKLTPATKETLIVGPFAGG